MTTWKALLKTAVYSFALKELRQLHPSLIVREGNESAPASCNEKVQLLDVHCPEQSFRVWSSSCSQCRFHGMLPTHAFLLMVSVAQYNISKVWTTIHKGQNFALTLFSLLAGSNLDFQNSVLLTKLNTSCEEWWSVSTSNGYSLQKEIQPSFCSQSVLDTHKHYI